MKSKLIMSGHGIEIKYIENQDGEYEIIDFKNMLKQRCYIEVGLNWFPFATGDHMDEQRQKLMKNADKKHRKEWDLW